MRSLKLFQNIPFREFVFEKFDEKYWWVICIFYIRDNYNRQINGVNHDICRTGKSTDNYYLKNFQITIWICHILVIKIFNKLL